MINADIVNLSLGICAINNKKKLYDICQELFNRGTLIIAAFDNLGMISFPAAFNNVLGVINNPTKKYRI